jgi:hypothetical protein
VTEPDTAWKIYCRDAADPWARYSPIDFQEPWERRLHPPKPKKTRRRMTLNRALKQAARAGVSVVNATLTPDGVRLEIANGNGHDDTNEWDNI